MKNEKNLLYELNCVKIAKRVFNICHGTKKDSS